MLIIHRWKIYSSQRDLPMSVTDERIIIDVKIGACKTDSFDEASDSKDEN